MHAKVRKEPAMEWTRTILKRVSQGIHEVALARDLTAPPREQQIPYMTVSMLRWIAAVGERRSPLDATCAGALRLTFSPVILNGSPTGLYSFTLIQCWRMSSTNSCKSRPGSRRRLSHCAKCAPCPCPPTRAPCSRCSQAKHSRLSVALGMQRCCFKSRACPNHSARLPRLVPPSTCMEPPQLP